MKIILEINKEGLNNKQIHNTLEFLEDLNYDDLRLILDGSEISCKSFGIKKTIKRQL